MLFDRPYTRVRTYFGLFELVILVWPHSFNEVRVASNHSVLPSGHNSVLLYHGSVLLSLFWAVKLQLCLPLVTLGSILVSASRYSVEVRRMSNLSALTFKSASQSCLKIHLDCLTAIKSNLCGLQDCLKGCRGGHQGELIHFLRFH